MSAEIPETAYCVVPVVPNLSGVVHAVPSLRVLMIKAKLNAGGHVPQLKIMTLFLFFGAASGSARRAGRRGWQGRASTVSQVDSKNPPSLPCWHSLSNRNSRWRTAT